ncbi:Arginine--tRNA ligase [Bienertia sinuspersici]
MACGQIQQQRDAPIVEAKAIILGLRLALQCQRLNAIVESDCLHVVKLLNGSLTGSYLGVIVREALVIANLFESVVFNYIPREANGAAHLMAHLEPISYTTRVLEGGCPSDLENVIAADFTYQ